ncbi:MAG: hypothetical protein R6X31_06910 [Anaerolineae bacterium]
MIEKIFQNSRYLVLIAPRRAPGLGAFGGSQRTVNGLILRRLRANAPATGRRLPAAYPCRERIVAAFGRLRRYIRRTPAAEPTDAQP